MHHTLRTNSNLPFLVVHEYDPYQLFDEVYKFLTYYVGCGRKFFYVTV